MSQIYQNLTKASVSQVQQAKAPVASEADVMALVIYSLMEAFSITTTTAIIHSKELKNNAEAQQALNNKAANMPWHSVPSLVAHRHSVRHTHVHWINQDGWYKTYSYTYYTTYANATQVQNQEAKNQRSQEKRQDIQARLNILQQKASISEANINTISDSGMQVMRASQFMEQAMRQITERVTQSRQG